MSTRTSTLVAIVLLASVLVPAPAAAQGTTHFGVTFPEGDRSFADIGEWQVFPQGSGNQMTDPTRAEGPPDCASDNPDPCFASLGVEANTGLLEVTFVDNALTADGTAEDDVYFFEAGSAVGGVAEEFSAEISVDGTEWISIGEVSGGEGTGIDIDPFADQAAQYRHVRMASTSSRTGGSTPGPDIDAVGAISSVAVDPDEDDPPPSGGGGTPGMPAVTDHSPTVVEQLSGIYRTVDGLGVRVRSTYFNLLSGGRMDQIETVMEVVENTASAACAEIGDRLVQGVLPYEQSLAGQGVAALQALTGARVVSEGPSCATRTDDASVTEVRTGADGLQSFTVDGPDSDPLVLQRTAPSVVSAEGSDPFQVNLVWIQSLAERLGWTSGSFAQTGERVLFVATDANFADALSVSGATGVARGLTLQISPTDGDGNRAAIARLRPTRLVVVGGPNALPDEVLPDPADVPRTRVFGQTRFDTAVELSRTYHPDGSGRVIVATGVNYPDALAGGALASLTQDPVLLVSRNAIPPEVAAELQRLQPSEIVVMGGQAPVSDEVVDELGRYATSVERYQGPNRYATAAEASQASTAGAAFAQQGTRIVYVANGDDYRNALVAASNAWVLGGPLLLTRPTSLPEETAAELRRLSPDRVVVLSDELEFDAAVHLQIAELMGG